MRSTLTKTINLGGGVDGISPKSQMRPSSLLRGINIECKNNGGYRRVLGYTRVGPVLAVAAASISGVVWDDDSPHDGIRNEGASSHLPGVTVHLFDGSLVLQDTTVTAADGTYSFTGLAAGTYTVDFSPPGSYLVSWNTNVGSDDTIDNDANNSTGATDPFVVAAGEAVVNVDCAMVDFG